MQTALAVLLALATSLFWLSAIVRHDDHEREPWPLVAAAFVAGGAVTFGVLWTRPWLEAGCTPLTPAIDAFVVTALAEEAWKALAFLPFLLARETDEPLDGAVYGAAVGLGFATLENVILTHATGDFCLLLQRASTATLLHAAASGCLGLACAAGKLRRFDVGTLAWFALGFAIAIGAHGCYDLWLCGDDAQAFVSLLLVLPTALAVLAWKVRWARGHSPTFHP
ncbi:MAG: PrsW family intramembrane metalloprotease [Planctomycetes bacterium]|nr:PrsW family intramembrane metalloprotease [Planctomycetota bacterium]